MAVAAWLVLTFIVIVWCGTWALQLAIGAVALAIRLAGWALMIAFGLMSLLALAVIDRKQLGRILRNQRVEIDNTALLVRERWG